MCWQVLFLNEFVKNVHIKCEKGGVCMCVVHLFMTCTVLVTFHTDVIGQPCQNVLAGDNFAILQATICPLLHTGVPSEPPSRPKDPSL